MFQFRFDFLNRIQAAGDRAVFVLSALMGFFYGVFVVPIWIETVEFGQVLAGIIKYHPSNPWYYEVMSSKTLMIFVPGLLLKLGFPEWPLCLLSSGVLCALGFSCVAFCTFFFSKNVIFSLLTPFFLLTYNFGSSHYYGVLYPITIFCFGQFGLWTCLLALCFLVLQRNRRAGFLLGLAPGMHVGWGMATSLMALLFSLAILRGEGLKVFKERLALFIRQGGVFFGAGLLISACCFIFQPKIFPTEGPGAEKIASYLPDDINPGVSPTLKNKIGLFSLWSHRNEDGFHTTHNIFIKDAQKPLQEGLRYFMSELLLLVLAFVCLIRLPNYLDGDAKIFLRTLVFFTLSLATYRFMDELSGRFLFLAALHGDLPYFVQRIIAGRWLNINMIVVPLLVLGILLRSLTSSGRVIAVLAFSFYAFLLSSPVGWGMVPKLVRGEPLRSSIGWLLIPAAILCLLAEKYSWLEFSKLNAFLESRKRFLGVFLLGLLIVAVGPRSIAALTRTWENRPVSGTDHFEELSIQAAKVKGTLIIPFFKGFEEYNPQMRIRRPMALPGPVIMFGPDALLKIPEHFNLRIFCLNVYDPSALFYVMDKIRTCFESKDLKNWQSLARDFDTTSVLVPEAWQIALPKAFSSDGRSLYHIPSSTN